MSTTPPPRRRRIAGERRRAQDEAPAAPQVEPASATPLVEEPAVPPQPPAYPVGAPGPAQFPRWRFVTALVAVLLLMGKIPLPSSWKSAASEPWKRLASFVRSAPAVPAPQPAPQPPAQPELPAPKVLLASANIEQPSTPTTQQPAATPKRRVAGRVTDCRCGDQQAQPDDADLLEDQRLRGERASRLDDRQFHGSAPR